MQSARYADAYAVARTVDTFGTVLKYLAAFAFALIFAGGAFGVLLVVSIPGPLTSDRFATAAMVGASGTFLASATGLVLFVTATLLCAQAQVLSATVDTAVNTAARRSDQERGAVIPATPEAVGVVRMPIGA